MSSSGKVTVITGPMFSGKSNEIIRRYTRARLAKKPVVVFKSSLDTRFEGESKVCTHNGDSIPAIPIRHTTKMMDWYVENVAATEYYRNQKNGSSDYHGLLWDRVQNINPVKTPWLFIIDECQFFDNRLIFFVDVLAEEGHEVVIAGTETTFAGKPFGIMGDLLCIADEVVKLDAVCVKCGKPATRNQRLIEGVPASDESPEIMVGASDTYEARCRNCHKVGD